jgi:hypothetical protein
LAKRSNSWQDYPSAGGLLHLFRRYVRVWLKLMLARIIEDYVLCKRSTGLTQERKNANPGESFKYKLFPQEEGTEGSFSIPDFDFRFGVAGLSIIFPFA